MDMCNGCQADGEMFYELRYPGMLLSWLLHSELWVGFGSDEKVGYELYDTYAIA